MTSEESIIEFTIKISARASEEINTLLKKTEQAKKNLEEIKKSPLIKSQEKKKRDTIKLDKLKQEENKTTLKESSEKTDIEEKQRKLDESIQKIGMKDPKDNLESPQPIESQNKEIPSPEIQEPKNNQEIETNRDILENQKINNIINPIQETSKLENKDDITNKIIEGFKSLNNELPKIITDNPEEHDRENTGFTDSEMEEPKTTKEIKKETKEEKDVPLVQEGQEKHELSKNAIDTLNKIDSKGLSTLSNLATNPESAVIGFLSKILTSAGPEVAVIITAIGTIVESPKIVQKIIQALAVRGGPLNRDWKRLISKEIDAGLTQDQIRRKEFGLDQLIFTQVHGFETNNVNWTFNSYYKINETRLARVGLSDRSAGILVQ